MSESTERSKTQIPIRADYFRIPEDPAKPPEILGTRCRRCNEHFFPQRAVCAKCFSRETEGVDLSPWGTLYSYTYVHFPMFGSSNPAHAGGYGVGQVDLPEGPRIQVPLAGTIEAFRVGQKVVAELERLRDDDFGRAVMLLRFRPLET